MSHVKDKKQQGRVQHEWIEPKSNDDEKKDDNIKDIVKNPTPKNDNNDEDEKKNVSDEKEKDKKENDDDVKANASDENKIAIVLIGITGVGKSSLIRLLSGNKDAVKVSGGAERGTSTITTVESKYNSNIYYIDTVGLQDSDAQKTDAKLLRGTLQYIHHEGFRKLKIIFCISGDTKTRKGLFSPPARFIGDLRVENDENDVKNDDGKKNKDDNSTKSPGVTVDAEEEGIAATMNATDDAIDNDGKEEEEGTNEEMAVSVWQSVLIIKKEGDADDDLSGVFAATISNGATKDIENKDKHFFGFKCSDWENYENDKWYKRIKEHEREEYGYYTADAAQNAIEGKLKSLPLFELKFEHKLCIRCGVNGDPRYMLEPCHTKPEQVHDPLKREHTGNQKLKHLGDIKSKTENVGHTHTGHKQQVHTGNNDEYNYHPGNKKSATAARVTSFVFTLSTSEWVSWYKEETWDYYDCCKKYENEAGAGCVKRWSCCNEDPSNTVCSRANETWTCCHRKVQQNSNSNGCSAVSKNVNLFDCCNKPVGSDGCEMIWSCCNQKGKGCKLYYPCCNNEDTNSEGCQTKCANCPVAWGKGPGCVIPQEYSQ